jgi:class 3 adenylate cyclase/tetratricopeptide (TPR) repeat protein
MPVLLGRDGELMAIDEALASARLGKSSCVLVRGEPGIGKTALLEYAAARAGSMRVLAARGVEFEADVAFAGLHELLHPTLSMLDRLPPIHGAALRSSLGLGARIEADRLIIGAAALGLISAYAEEAPLLITLDDAQWLDRASAEALAFAARRLFADPVAMVIALREGEESPLAAAGLPELRLRGLDLEFGTALLQQAAAGRVSPDVARWMLEATGGNPLALLELGHEAPRMSASPHDNLPVATSVERAYLRRTDGLSEGARRVLLVMAASGTAELRLVLHAARALELKPADVEQAEAARGIVVQRGNRVEFVHPLARAAIYHSATPGDRRAAHRAMASVMTEPDDVDRRAWHLASASTGWDADAAIALEAAARRARESSGYAAAARAWRESARLTEMPEERTARLFNAADNAWLAGRVEDAIDLLGEARSLAETHELRMDIDALSGQIAMRRGSVVEGYRLLVHTAQAVEAVDRLKSIRILADAVLSTFGAGQPSDMLADARKAIDLLRPDDPPEVAIFAHVAYGALVVLAGHGSDGPMHFRECVELFKKVPAENADPLVLICACFVGLFLREAEAGRDLLERAVALAREHAPTAALPTLLFMLGRDAAATDRWPLARAHYEEGARVARETTQFTRLSGEMAGLAWLDALEGRVDECRSHAAEAIQLCDEYGMGLYEAWSLTALGQLEQGLGHQEEALQHFVSCESLLASVSISDPDISPVPDIVDTLVRLGRLPDAREAAARYQPSAEAKAQPFALARAARARALVADDDTYIDEYETALRHHRDTPDVFEQARTQLYYGERLRRSRRRVDARRHLREALNAFDHLGAAPWAQRAMQELHASGETARVRDDSSRQQLTPQELQVAMTLAEGATTREAAARLYLSPKTVEYHLRHVYDKFEIRSREELRKVVLAQSRPIGSKKALLFTDVAGSTSLVEAIGDKAWHDLSTWMDGEMRRSFEEFKGREVDHAGDGFFVVFDGAADAIECASIIQRRLSNHRRLHGYAPQVRIGIHVGEVHGSDSTVRGAAVHRAARLCAAAPADGIIVSREALEASGRQIVGLQKFALKGIKEPVEAAEVRWEA